VRSADAVVVGAGVIGASTAYYLARAGVATILVERSHTPAGATASSASAGGVRQQGRVDPEIPLAIESIRMWRTLEDDLGMDLHYRRGGMAICTDRPDGLAGLQARVDRERGLGLEDVRLVEGDALRRLVPGIASRIVGASYCPTDGQADPMRTTRAFALGAERLGARLLWRCALTGLRRDGRSLAGVETSEGPIACRSVVLAAGAWTPALAERCGFPLPMIRPGFLQMLSTARRPPRLEQVLGWVGQGISLKQVPAGAFVIGGGWPGRGDLERYETAALPGSMARSAATAVALFPELASAPLVRAWVGIESFARDDYPILSAVPGHPGVIVAAGFSGHGFAIAPGVGRRLAEWISTARRPEILAPFDIARFQQESAHARSS
jgi:sarcosine oxidase subunit beta